MAKYIVSAVVTQDQNPVATQVKYNHDAVKLAYKAGAVVYWKAGEDGPWLGIGRGNKPSWHPLSQYRAIITDDMPPELLDMVNWIDIGDRVEVSYEVDNQGDKRHKWADVIIAMANGEETQWQDFHGDWNDPRDRNPISHPGCEWRIKPRTIKIGDMEVPEPLQKKSELEVDYYISNPFSESLFDYCRKRNDAFDRLWLRRGLCHSTKDAAIAHAKALIAISGGTV